VHNHTRPILNSIALTHGQQNTMRHHQDSVIHLKHKTGRKILLLTCLIGSHIHTSTLALILVIQNCFRMHKYLIQHVCKQTLSFQLN